jgi:hypothetical protein
MYFGSEMDCTCAILVICILTCYINEKLCIFVYKCFGFIWMHMNIYICFQNLNILCSFWSAIFFFGLVRFHISWVDQFGSVSGSDSIDPMRRINILKSHTSN